MKVAIAAIAFAVALPACQTVESIKLPPDNRETSEECPVHAVRLIEVNGYVYDTPNPPSVVPEYANLHRKFPQGIPFGRSLRPTEYTPLLETFSYCPVCEDKISEGRKKLQSRWN
jgi:hypothetical protein